jgi:predicted Zn-dependent protease
MPALSRPIYIDPSLNLSEASKSVILNKIEEYRAELKKSPASLDVWIDLGIYQKMAGDFSGAAETWKYASQIAPTDYVSLGNLGNLYSYFLSDPKTAESYYQAAIINGPTQSYLYVQFAEMYRDIEKNSAKALAVVQNGLSKIPDDQNLISLRDYLMKK